MSVIFTVRIKTERYWSKQNITPTDQFNRKKKSRALGSINYGLLLFLEFPTVHLFQNLHLVHFLHFITGNNEVNEGFRHRITQSFMVSGPNQDREGWAWIDNKLPESDVCSERDASTVLPNSIVYSVRTDFMSSCNAPLIWMSPSDIAMQYSYNVDPNDGSMIYVPLIWRKCHAFLMCQTIWFMNEVASHYKYHHCSPGTANYNKTLSLAECYKKNWKSFKRKTIWQYSK